LTSGTVMQSTHTPLSTWFWGAYLITTQTPGQSALQFQRQLGLTRYETAFQILHKLRAGMVRPERDRIGEEHVVEVDECFVGGRTRGEGRGIHHKVVVVGAVEVRLRKDAELRAAKHKQAHDGGVPLKKLVYAGRLRLRVIGSRGSEDLVTFVTDNVAKGSTVRTDAWVGYEKLPELGYVHDPLAITGDADKVEGHLPMIHLVFSNLKTWMHGTHHGCIGQQHLQAYLNEFVFRFNRRFYPMTAFNSVLGIAAHATSPTYEQLYSGEWQHPAA
jgi:transposase-like protein